MVRFLALALLFACPAVFAVEPDGPSQLEMDYSLQGEYRGFEQPGGHRSVESVGLQVVSLGNGRFEAVKFPGGLPGQLQHRSYRAMYQGFAQGDSLELSGERYDILMADGLATLRKHNGDFAGTLKRVERTSPTLGLSAPKGAVVLFDGTGTDHWQDAKLTKSGLLMAGTQTRLPFGDFRLHGEFRLPFKPLGRGQDRGNSGFYLQSRYEVQVLDSFGLRGVENECGAIYKLKRPDVNMCFPPLVWQTYDIDFTSATYDSQGLKSSNMEITVWHNGVRIHSHASIPDKTGAGQPEGPFPLPLKLQDHGNPVVYRNIWLIPRNQGPTVAIPLIPEHAAQPPVPIYLGL